MTFITLNKKLWSILIAAFCFCNLYSQNQAKYDDNFHAFWIEGGLGGTTNSFVGIGLNGSYNFKNNYVLSLRATSNFDFNFNEETDYVNDAALLFGYLYKRKYYAFYTLTGVAYVKGQNVFGYEVNGSCLGSKCEITYFTEKYATIGLPLEFNAMFIPIKYGWIGVKGYANINSKKSFAGYLVTVGLARIRK